MTLRQLVQSRDPEIARRVVGWFLELLVKAYGAAAALSVALSDAETVAGKVGDAVGAVDNLADRYHDAKYVIEHREQIQTSLDYVNEHAPDQDELESAAQQSTETLTGIETTYDELVRAKESLGFSPGDISEAAGHVVDAWAARPDLGSIRELADAAEDVVPFVEQVQVLVPALYGPLLTVADNFARDEIVGTIAVMAAALVAAFLVGTAIGFVARRGTPGLVARTLQGFGVRAFPGWYERNLQLALGPPLYAVARRRTQADIVADPQRALDPEAFRELELYFDRRRAGSGS